MIETMKRKDILIPWLKEQGVYEQFMHNLEEDSKDIPNGVQERLEYESDWNDIQCAFVWSHTKEKDEFWREIDRRWVEYSQSRLLKTEVDTLPFSKRVQDVLRNEEVYKVEDITKHNRSDFRKYRNFGKKSLHELDDFMEFNRLKYKDERE